VSVAFSYNGDLSLGGDDVLSHLVQPNPSMDEKPMDNLFDFDQFPEGLSSAPEQPTFGMADSDVDLYESTLFGLGSHSNPFAFPEGFEAKFSDLQSASGATYVSDEALAAEL
jgi:transcriptional activator HAC1